MALSRPPHSQSTSWPEARSQAFQTQSSSDCFSSSPTSRRARSQPPVLPARAFGLGRRELLQPSLNCGSRDAEEARGLRAIAGPTVSTQRLIPTYGPPRPQEARSIWLCSLRQRIRSQG